jgi:hypothetical protein
VIGRLGEIAPRDFVEKCGITFPSDKPDAIPVLSSKYESNVLGLYIIGALAGYPLIKQAMNQGYDVIEFILGNNIRPVDHESLAALLCFLIIVMWKTLLNCSSRFLHLCVINNLCCHTQICAGTQHKNGHFDADACSFKKHVLHEAAASGKPIIWSFLLGWCGIKHSF